MASRSAKNSKSKKNSKRGNNGGGNRTKVTDKKKEKFLLQLVETGGNVTTACEMVCLARKTMYEHRAKNKKFAEDWDKAVDKGIDRLEDEAKRRACSGILEPVFYKGVCVDFVRKYSDTLLIFLLKGHRDKYKERHEVTGKADEPVVLKVISHVPGE